MTGTRIDSLQPESEAHKETVKGINSYATKKTVAQGLMDIGLLMANAAQLRAMIKAGSETEYFWPVVVMIALSILLQVIVGVILMVMGGMTVKSRIETRHVHLLNDFTVGLIFVVTILNVFIAAFGITISK